MRSRWTWASTFPGCTNFASRSMVVIASLCAWPLANALTTSSASCVTARASPCRARVPLTKTSPAGIGSTKAQLKAAIEQAKKSGERAPDLGRIEQWVPEGVASFVVWLCSEAAKDVNGQDFVISAEQVSLMSQPRPTATVFSAEPWTIDELDKVLPQTLVRDIKALSA